MIRGGIGASAPQEEVSPDILLCDPDIFSYRFRSTSAILESAKH